MIFNLYQSRNLFFLLFAVSGFTGLIYESIWSHYLKLFLGHASYAQALVLMIFMGGMAWGAWLASHWVKKWKNLLVIYALVEGIIGLFGLGFHTLFQFTLSISYDGIIPALGSPTIVHFYKWTVATILILPQSILLGMTFPLMSNGIIRRFPGIPGNSISILYFTNSLGAAIGILFSGFYLIKLVGLPGTIMTAGLLNIILAIVVYSLAREDTGEIQDSNTENLSSRLRYIILFAAFITGTASFIYEISWIRMLNMVLGTSTHSFELMLSAFITGLAFGSFFIRKYIEQLENPVQVAAYIQLLMGLMAISTLPLYNITFDLMEFFMAALERSIEGYILYNFIKHLIALLVMLPTTLLAGMTLPLFTFILLRSGGGEKSIGQVYACNTLGAIAGVLFTIFVAMPFFGLKVSMLIGSSLDMILGILLFITATSFIAQKKLLAFSLVCLCILISVSIGVQFDHKKMTSGIFRSGKATVREGEKNIFYKDGMTASISVNKFMQAHIIATNGKPDASIDMASRLPTGDEGTAILAAALPLGINPDVKTVANIGMGSGLTSHTLLKWRDIQRVDTIEIEPAMVEGAQYFRPRVELVFTDPRSRIYIEDAKIFFSTHQNKYDLIISEPSNPWVSGVSSLFTSEFYGQVKRNLNDDGMLVQWIQLYELNNNLVYSILKALSKHFSDFRIYAATNNDIIIISKKTGMVQDPGHHIFQSENMGAQLSAVKINNLQDLRSRYIGNKKLLNPLIVNTAITENSDYFPIVDLYAPRSMYLDEYANDFIALKTQPIPLVSALTESGQEFNKTNVTYDNLYVYSQYANDAIKIYNYLIKNNSNINDAFYNIYTLIDLNKQCNQQNNSQQWISALYQLMLQTLPYLQPEEIDQISKSLKPDCIVGLNEEQEEWLQLYKNLGVRNFEKSTELTQRLLNKASMWPIEQSRFLFYSYMLGLVTRHEYNHALLFWGKNVASYFNPDNIPIELKVLWSIVHHNTQKVRLSNISIKQ